jgi:hypothetical protein
MLSSQTKDTVNFATMIKLRAHGLTPANILATDDETLDGLIRAVGFHNNKVKFLKQTAAILISQHGGRVPDTMAQLLSLPGVGPKMSLILLSVVYNKVQWPGGEEGRGLGWPFGCCGCRCEIPLQSHTPPPSGGGHLGRSLWYTRTRC